VTADGSHRLEATVRGYVQGVGFRWYVHRSAAGLGLVGWVANLADGSVAVVAEGSVPALDRLEQALREGPAGAVVQEVQARRLPASGSFSRFEIRSGAHRGD
jgi:acylphosphatase